jgi:hypothetical protein
VLNLDLLHGGKLIPARFRIVLRSPVDPNLSQPAMVRKVAERY